MTKGFEHVIKEKSYFDKNKAELENKQKKLQKVFEFVILDD